MASEEELRLVLRAVDQYSTATTDLIKRIEAISQRAETAQGEAQDLGRAIQNDLAGSRTSTGLSNLLGQFGELSGVINRVVALVGGGLAVTGLGKAIQMALDVGEAGAGLLNLERAFGNFTASVGQNADEVIAEMQRMSAGMLSETQAMEQYNRTFLLSGAEMAAEMPRLIQLAIAASAAGMGEFGHLLNSLTIGIGRLSPLWLDNLGISIKLSDAYETYGRTIGKSAEELTKAEQQQALLNEVMRIAEGRFGDLDGAAANMAGTSIPRLRAAWSDLGDELKTRTVPAVEKLAEALLGVVDATMANIPGTKQNLDLLLDTAEAMAATGDLSRFRTVGLDKGILEELRKSLDAMDEEQRRRLQALSRTYETAFPKEAEALATRYREAWVTELERTLAEQERIAQARIAIEEGATGHLILNMQRMAADVAMQAKDFGEQSTQADNSRYALENLLQTVQGLSVSQDAYSQIQQIANQALGEQAAATALAAFEANNYVGAQGQATSATSQLTAELNRQRIAQLGLTDSTVLMEQHAEMLAQAELNQARAAQRAAEAMRQGKGSLEAHREEGSRANRVIQELVHTLGEQEFGALKASAGIDTLRRAWAIAAKQGRDLATVVAELTARIEGVKGSLLPRDPGHRLGATVDGFEAAAGGASSLESALESLAESWESTIAGFLTPSQSVNITDIRDQMGMHEDTWDEFARRRADVVNLGAESPWTPEEWMGLPDEEIKRRALQDIEDFYSFRLPEAVDTEALKQKVRDFVETQNNISALVEQVRTELSAEGLDITTPEVQQALGVDLGAVGAADAGDYNSAFLGVLSGAGADYEKTGKDFVGAIKAGMLAEAKGSAQFRKDFTEALMPDLDEAALRAIRKYLGGGGELP